MLMDYLKLDKARLKRLGIDNENIKRSEKVQNYTDAANDKIATDAQTANDKASAADKLQMINHKQKMKKIEAYKTISKKIKYRITRFRR
jgi:predicted HicB family RNase H-like nuclease